MNIIRKKYINSNTTIKVNGSKVSYNTDTNIFCFSTWYLVLIFKLSVSVIYYRIVRIYSSRSTILGFNLGINDIGNLLIISVSILDK
jgi:hypothetical protein